MNKYNSLSDTFIATDLYNLPLPVLPPADLSLANTQFAPSYMYFRMGGSTKVVGFNKKDKPYFTSVGMSSNLAAGLVDAASAHEGDSNSWRITYQLERFAAKLTGTVSNVAGNAALTGAGTSFTTQVAVGSVLVWMDTNRVIRSGTVLTVTDDTNIVLTAVSTNAGMLTANTVNSAAYPLIGNAGVSVTIPFITMNTLYPVDFFLGDVSKVYPPLGVIQTAAASAAVVGTSTSFVTDFVVGQPIAWGTGADRRTGVISVITDQTHLTLAAVADLDRTGQALLDYDDHLRIKCVESRTFLAYTINIDPRYGDGTRRLSIHALAGITHNYPLSEAI